MKSDLVESSQDTITGAAVTGSAVKMIPEGATLIVVRSGILARTVPVAIAACELTVNQDLKALIPGEAIDSRYLNYFMRSAEQYLLSRVTRGATVHKLDSDVLKTLHVPLPRKEEQKRIVAILDEAFAGIATAVANTEKNLANARELFESYLSALFDRICRERGSVKLGDVCKTGSGGTPLKSERLFYQDGTIPWLLSGEVSRKEITEASKFITEHGLKNSSAKVFPVNTVLVAMYGATAGQAGILRFASATNQAICGVYPNDRFLPDFLYYNFLYRTKELVATASGNAQPNISQIKIKNVLVPNLPRDGQMAANQSLKSLNEESELLVENYKRKLQSLAELKQSLLQKAFSGELTAVPQDEIETALA